MSGRSGVKELRFMVVVAERDKYCLLITAFYLEHDHSLRKKLKKYAQYKAKNMNMLECMKRIINLGFNYVEFATIKS